MKVKPFSIKNSGPPQMLAFGFLGLILLGALLLMLPLSTYEGHHLSFIDALFEATSSVCVTGLIVVDTDQTFTLFGQIVLMTLIQIGGLGFMTASFFVAILLGKQIGLQDRMLLKNVLNNLTLSGVVKLTKWIIIITFIVEGIGAILLTVTWEEEMGWGQALYYGLFHSVSAFNNAGFDLMEGRFSSLVHYALNVPVNLIITFLFIIGGIGYTVLTDLFQKKKIRYWSLHTKLVLLSTFTVNVLATLLVLLFEYHNPATLGNLPLGDKFLAAWFQGVVPRTAGFNTIDLTALREDTQVFMMGLMFIGASPGSTGGGIKITTFVLLVLVVWSFITGKEEINIMGRRIPADLINKALSIAVISVFFIFIAVLILNFTEPFAPFKMVTFEVISAFGTVGLSLGLTPDLSPIGKLVIIAMMFIGRLGPLTIAFALTRQVKQSSIKHPKEKILIG